MKRIKSDQIEYTSEELLFRTIVTVLGIIILLFSLFNMASNFALSETLDNFEVKEICEDGYTDAMLQLSSDALFTPMGVFSKDELVINVEWENCYASYPIGFIYYNDARIIIDCDNIEKVPGICKSEPIKVLAQKESQ